MLEQFFLYNNISEDQKTFLHKVLDLGFNFIDGTIRDKKVFKYLTNDKLKDLLCKDMCKTPLNYDQLYSVLKTVAEFSIPQSDQRYLSFPDTGNSVASIAAEIINAFLNQNMIAVDRSAPIGTFIEIQLILWLRQLIGYKTESFKDINSLSQVGGMWTTGGNLSNYIAIHTALRNRFPEVVEHGIISLKKKPVIIVAKGIEHYSFSCAVQNLGLGKDSIVWCDVNGDFTTNIKSLQNVLDNIGENLEPFMVVAVAGNCRTSSIDDLLAIRKICEKYKLWFHVDACHGGSLVFSNRLKDKIKGIELGDSVSLDPHKGLFVGYASSYVLFKNPIVMESYCRYSDKFYKKDCMDLGLITPFLGSRKFESLKLWLMIKHLGLNGLEAAIDSRDKTFLKVIEIFKKTNYFTFFNEPCLYRAAFVFFPLEVRKYVNSFKIDYSKLKPILNMYTKKFCNQLYKLGKVIIDIFSLQDFNNNVGLGLAEKYDVMGISIGHPFISNENFLEIESNLSEIGEKLKSEMLADIKCSYDLKSDTESANLGPASW